jgi:tetratricopeptide (TPR) repeat protein
MKPSSNLFATLAILLLALAAAAQTYPASSDSETQLGVEAYKESQYDEAIQHFEKAVELDGSNLKARFYMGTAYASQYIPGVDSPDNLQFARKAIEQYEYIINSDAEHDAKLSSAKGLGYLYLNMKNFERALNFYSKASYFDPQDPENHYYMGVIYWTESYEPRMKARAKLGMRTEENLDAKNEAQKKACDKLSVQYHSTIEAGISSLRYAIFLRPDYADAMAYLNLMYRERADVECDDLSARAQDLKTADAWVDKIMAIKKAKAEKQQSLRPRPNQQQ